MRRFMLVGLGAIAVSACGPSEGSRLEPGSELALVYKDHSTVSIHADPSGSGGWTSVDAGAKVRVIDDSRDDDSIGHREVKVRVIEGRYDGLIGYADRHDLMPISR